MKIAVVVSIRLTTSLGVYSIETIYTPVRGIATPKKYIIVHWGILFELNLETEQNGFSRN
jgi:hypothetical protein